ncbi:bifunctional epoxide hydrolase 2-like isoform X1 [Asterias amurensis]|uniref:bifunctional epoxide hydrolase 2-like isoform X1 n=2 Tax=Asterias amurensis TaxID=7602 RepID=UPI003AB8CB30
MKTISQTMAFKAVIFDIGGVLIESPIKYLMEFATKHGLPPTFMLDEMRKGAPNNAMCQCERGQLAVSQLVEELHKGATESAKKQNLSIPSAFSVTEMMKGLLCDLRPQREMFNAAINLKNNGFKIGVVTNDFTVDLPTMNSPPEYFRSLNIIFDDLVESCRTGLRKPEPEIYDLACKRLGVAPQETIFVDDLGGNLKGANSLGITTVLFKDAESTLKKLQELTGVDVYQEADPISVDPDRVSHGLVTTKEGVQLHFVEMGEGPAIILCHGFPESWYSWRKQIPALAMAGYRVIALDQRGYGDSSSPPDIKAYSHDHLCKDVIAVMDSLNIPMATFIGHDWGGAIVWKLAIGYPERTRGVVGVNTPYFPPNPNANPLEQMHKKPGVFDYQLYFQTPGVAEAELESNLEKLFKYFFRAPTRQDYFPGREKLGVHNVRERGGLLAGVPDDLTMPSLITEKELAFYVKEFKKSGFRGPLNWYRNIEENWRNSLKFAGRKIYAPALMVTAEKDLVLTPASSRFMEPWVPNLSRLHIKNCGHWTQIERPKELNDGLLNWLNDLHGKETSIKSLDAKL